MSKIKESEITYGLDELGGQEMNGQDMNGLGEEKMIARIEEMEFPEYAQNELKVIRDTYTEIGVEGLMIRAYLWGRLQKTL